MQAALTAIVLVGSVATLHAQPTPETEIRSALERWTAAFNAREADKICDLFATDLRYLYRGFPERGYPEMCALLKRSLADDKTRYAYKLGIQEIIVSGDLAVVRLVWTLEILRDGAPRPATVVEPGLDVFRRQPDGAWKIVRYIAYED